jgi:hypothetical protein
MQIEAAVTGAVQRLGRPVTPKEILAHIAESSAPARRAVGIWFRRDLLRLAKRRRIERYAFETLARGSHFAPLGWIGSQRAAPPSRQQRIRNALSKYTAEHGVLPFTSRMLRGIPAAPKLTPKQWASALSSLTRSGDLVRVGRLGGATLFADGKLFRSLSPSARKRLKARARRAMREGPASGTFTGGLELLVVAAKKVRLRGLSMSDRAIVETRPLTDAELRAPVLGGRKFGPVNSKTISRAIQSATSRGRKHVSAGFRCLGSAARTHFYGTTASWSSPFVDLRFAQHRLELLLQSHAATALTQMLARNLNLNGIAIPGAIAAQRCAEMAARCSCYREAVQSMNAPGMLTSAELEKWQQTDARAVEFEATLLDGVRAHGGDAIQLALLVPDIPDDGALVATTSAERAFSNAGLDQFKSARALSGELARRLGGVERVVSARIPGRTSDRLSGGKNRVYLRRSLVLCYVLRRWGGLAWHAAAAIAAATLGELSDSTVFEWLLNHGSEAEVPIAAACLAILDTVSARECLAQFLISEGTRTDRASAATEFALLGLSKKPVLPRVTALEHTHGEALNRFTDGRHPRLSPLAQRVLLSWQPTATEAMRLAL